MYTIPGNCKLRLEFKIEWSYKAKHWKLSVYFLIIFCNEQVAFLVPFTFYMNLLVYYCKPLQHTLVKAFKCKNTALY